MKNKETGSVCRNIHHVGVVVSNLNRAVQYYQVLGIGPFAEMDLSEMKDKTMYGKPIDFKLRMAAAQIGPIGFELIQPVKNAPLFDEFLKTSGEGVHHIAFSTDNVNEDVAKLVKKGLKVILSTKTPTGGAVYLDSGKVGGVVLELLQE